MSPTHSDDLKLSKLLRCKIDGLGSKSARLFAPLQARDPARLARVFRFSYHASCLAALMHTVSKEAEYIDGQPLFSTGRCNLYVRTAMRWCHNEGLHVSMSTTQDLPVGSSLPPLSEEEFFDSPESGRMPGARESSSWVGYLSCGQDPSIDALLPRLLRAVGHHLAGRLLVDEDQESMADVFVTVALGVLTALEAGTVGLDHPIVLAAQRLLEEERGI